MSNVRARDLRKSMARQEVKLWRRLRELRSIGHHFRRQSPLAPYIVDFECRRSRVIVEVDGHQHGFDDHRRRDDIRDQELQRRGYKILRFSNGEVDREIEVFSKPSSRRWHLPTRPLRGHPPLAGRDETAG